jgi:hypothetical protein
VSEREPAVRSNVMLDITSHTARELAIQNVPPAQSVGFLVDPEPKSAVDHGSVGHPPRNHLGHRENLCPYPRYFEKLEGVARAKVSRHYALAVWIHMASPGIMASLAFGRSNSCTKAASLEQNDTFFD